MGYKPRHAAEVEDEPDEPTGSYSSDPETPVASSAVPPRPDSQLNGDARRSIPRTDRLLGLPEAKAARERFAERQVREIVTTVQARARAGEIAPHNVEREVVGQLSDLRSSEMRAVLNATGIVIHTNLGRAPLGVPAIGAMMAAGGYVDVELDLRSGRRSGRGRSARRALLQACPTAQDALIVNNAAAALLLAATALAGGREVLISRGELIEIGAGFRLPDLIESAGARLREVGSTNRTHLRDYTDAVNDKSGCIFKVHPSNYRINGFTSDTTLRQLRGVASDHDLPLVVDIGSGLLEPDPALPDEPDATTALRAGADLVIASGDKLLGGPQAGIVLGRTDLVRRLAQHPLARAMRIDKIRLAALEATLTAASTPVYDAIHASSDDLRRRTQAVAAAIGVDDDSVVPHVGRVGGGGAPEVPLDGWAIRLPEELGAALRTGTPPVLAHTNHGSCLVDLRCVPATKDGQLAAAIRAAFDRRGHQLDGTDARPE